MHLNLQKDQVQVKGLPPLKNVLIYICNNIKKENTFNYRLNPDLYL